MNPFNVFRAGQYGQDLQINEMKMKFDNQASQKFQKFTIKLGNVNKVHWILNLPLLYHNKAE